MATDEIESLRYQPRARFKQMPNKADCNDDGDVFVDRVGEQDATRAKCSDQSNTGEARKTNCSGANVHHGCIKCERKNKQRPDDRKNNEHAAK